MSKPTTSVKNTIEILESTLEKLVQLDVHELVVVHNVISVILEGEDAGVYTENTDCDDDDCDSDDDCDDDDDNDDSDDDCDCKCKKAY